MRKIATANRQPTIALSLLAILLLGGTVASQTRASKHGSSDDPSLQRLEREIARLAAVSGGVAGTEIAHKTGTIGGSTNDVGIISLPDNAGHVAIAVFTKSSDKDAAARDRGIAEIARAVYDFFLFQPRASS